MDDESKKFLNGLYKENSLFLNKAMLAIPAAAVPVFLSFLNKMDHCIFSAIIILSSMCFTIAVLFLLHSFFISEKAIDTFDEDKEESKRLNDKTKRRNKLAFNFIVLGFIMGFIAILGNIFFVQISYKPQEKAHIASDNIIINSKTALPNQQEKLSIDSGKLGLTIPREIYDDPPTQPPNKPKSKDSQNFNGSNSDSNKK